MLYCLLDGHARTSTELAAVAGVGASTASVHLARMIEHRLLTMHSQGRYRYFGLAGPGVARALEALSVIAGKSIPAFSPATPMGLRWARTCYDHMAGYWAVRLRDRFEELEWLMPKDSGHQDYELTANGSGALAAIGIDIESTRAFRRRFAYACMDWSERRPHIGGALGFALLKLALARAWFVRDLDSRALTLTAAGRRQLQVHFGLQASAGSLGAAPGLRSDLAQAPAAGGLGGVPKVPSTTSRNVRSSRSMKRLS